MATLHEFTVQDINGDTQALTAWRGQVVLIVNVASHCGLTPQYRALNALHQHYRDRGFAVLGFPCNQFGAQEPGSEAQILHFCHSTYDVNFPLFAKLNVNGPDAHPLYRWLTHEHPGILGSRAIKWNFTKFLVGRDGQVRKRYAPITKPESLAADIEAALAETSE